MFSIYLDDKPLWTPKETDKRLIKPTANLGLNKVGSASFSILPGHPYYDSFVKMQSIITIRQDNRILLKGRVYGNSEDFYKTKTIEVEGILGYFNDSIVRSYDFNGSVENYLRFLINQHNDQVEDYQKFKLGKVTVKDPNNYIVRASTEHPNTWSEINSKLIDLLGGYICIRYEEDGNYIDYLEDFTDVATQEIAFSVNLLDLTSESKADTLATCIIPYGAKDTTAGTTVDITSVNGGVDYIEDPDAVAKYGKIFEVVTWDDVTIPANLLTKAKAYLSSKVKLSNKFTIKAIDLHLADETIESFKLGDYVKIFSEPHDLNDKVLLTAYSMDLSNPANSTITLGLEKSSYLADSVKDNTERVDKITTTVGDMITQSAGNIMSQTQTYINNQITNSEENTQIILKEYTSIEDTTQLKESISTVFKQTADELGIQFNSINERITEENGEIIKHLDEISKYIRFKDGDIILGEVGNALTTKISNGRISFLYNDNIEVAYITDQKLYITRAEILDQIVIGSFAFMPRSNGNLSFTKV